MKLSVKIHDLKKSPEILWNEIHSDTKNIVVHIFDNNNKTHWIIKQCVILLQQKQK